MTNGKATTILASTLMAGLAVATLASPANASTTYTWIQQVQRASADAPCDIPTIEGDAAGWSDWGPSWAQWPHDGQGGWVCTRSITWAQGSAPGGLTQEDAGGLGGSCVRSFEGYLDFMQASWLPSGTAFYSDDACTLTTDDPAPPTVAAVLADDAAAAKTLCDTHAGYPVSRADLVGGPADPRLYWCIRQ